MEYGRVDAGAIAEFKTLLGDRLNLATAVRESHGHDEGRHRPELPDIVLFPNSTAETAEIVKICARRRLPIIPFGAGTGLEGGVNAPFGGVSLDTSEMREILRVSVEDMDCSVQAGVTRQRLNTRLRDTGLFFAVDPGGESTFGGMAATRASGTNAVRYGTMRETVLGLTVVLPDGRIIHTGGRARKSAAGYDLTRLFVGSEGTLGVITEVTLRLTGIPEAVTSAVCPFETLEGAIDTVIETIQMSIPVARVEIMDENMIRGFNLYTGHDLPETPTLFFEFHGTPAWAEEQARTVGELAEGNGAREFRWTADADERNRLWEARHKSYYACGALRPGSKTWSSDVCVPISALRVCLTETKADLEESGMITTIIGHVGDGNFHVAFMIDPDDPREVAQVERLNDRIVERALRLGGTCTGEHGIGQGKIDFLESEAGDALSVMRDVKRTLDPLNIMNPGKVVRF